ncbi:MAG: YHS domain-containing protein [Anaerolineae bacterium]|nr:YHS domain-containing protein [Anaerolineae bacterium]
MTGVLIAALLLSLAANVWLALRVLRPLRRLSDGARGLAEGDFNALCENCGGVTDIDVLRRSMVAMAGHVQRAQVQGSAYAGALTKGQESERHRVARELHDETVQALVAIGQSIDLARTWVQRDPGRANVLLTTAREQATGAVDTLRGLIADLRPPALEELGLVAALRTLAERATDIQVRVTVKGQERRLDKEAELALFRSAQEGLTNARKHGRARSAEITVEYRADAARLTVRDDGQGLKETLTSDGLHDLASSGHYGLLGIQERVISLGGTLSVTGTPGGGTTLSVRLPTSASAQPADTVRDPVCSALIAPQQAYGSVVYEGQTYYFCCPVCRGAFQRDPQAYLGQ